jgi:hypothetical protein
MALVAALVVGFVSPNALAQDEAGLLSQVSGGIGVDFTTEYYFRGIAQENQGFIAQPYADVSVNLASDQGNINSIDLHVNAWNSIHDGPSGSDGPPNDAWYELDFTVGVGVAFLDVWSADVSYIIYNSPNNAFTTTQEFDFTLGYDDSTLWGDDFALSPSMVIAVETTGGADAGANLGIYLQLGIEPSWVIIESETWPVTFAIPVTVGLSIDDYYEDAMGDDDFFGYLDVGLVLSTPLTELIPSQFGEWELSVGVHFLTLGDTAQDIAERDFAVDGDAGFEVIGVLGLSMGF